MRKIGLSIAEIILMVTASSILWIVGRSSLSSTFANTEAHTFHDSQILYQSPFYFCNKREGLDYLFIRSELGNVPAIVFKPEDGEGSISPETCVKLVERLNGLMKTKGVRFLTWWDTSDGNYEVKISESEGYAIVSNKHYLFTLESKNNPGDVVNSLRGIASTYGGDAVIIFE